MGQPLEALVARLRSAGCVYAEEEAALLADAASGEALERLLERRLAGEPLEHVLGWVEFCGLRVRVGPGVFVPRRRTELLAHEATAVLSPGEVLVELCCGAAAVAAAVAAMVPGLQVYAVDLDPVALSMAEANLPEGRVLRGDLYDALPPELRGQVQVVVANAPYVPSAAVALMPAEARLHEPALALDGGSDGLDVQRRIAAGAPMWLALGGQLIMETSAAQLPASMGLVAGAGLRPWALRDEDLGATAVAGTRSA